MSPSDSSASASSAIVSVVMGSEGEGSEVIGSEVSIGVVESPILMVVEVCVDSERSPMMAVAEVDVVFCFERIASPMVMDLIER